MTLTRGEEGRNSCQLLSPHCCDHLDVLVEEHKSLFTLSKVGGDHILSTPEVLCVYSFVFPTQRVENTSHNTEVDKSQSPSAASNCVSCQWNKATTVS